MGFREFIGMVAGLMALNALAIDIMLPALPQIGSALAVEDENTRQVVLSAYLVGFGGGAGVCDRAHGDLEDPSCARAGGQVGRTTRSSAAVS